MGPTGTHKFSSLVIFEILVLLILRTDCYERMLFLEKVFLAKCDDAEDGFSLALC